MKFKSGNDSRMAAASRLRGRSGDAVEFETTLPFPGMDEAFKISAVFVMAGSGLRPADPRSFSSLDVSPESKVNDDDG
jgi:hypothetical protein